MDLTTPGPGTLTPPELAAKLGHYDGEGSSERAGRKIRKWLRKRFPEHPSGALWHIPAEVADMIAGELPA